MTLRDRITEDMKAAMRAKAVARLSTIRLLLAAIKQREVDERRTLSDADVVAVIDKMVKQRKDSIAQFDAGHRPDLANAERAEIAVLDTYLPQRMSEAEIAEAVAAAISAARAAGAAGPAVMGKVMAALKTELAGRADMAQVAAAVKARL
ncbi:MAG TPA: GatB/YqeY domain-containing protein [Casimicrobiaceae bacterium]|nr:GatB/YqeY domain-containing protein [Casimicrobiaceae bacterium]